MKRIIVILGIVLLSGCGGPSSKQANGEPAKPPRFTILSQNDGVTAVVFRDNKTGECYLSWNNTDSVIVKASKETCE